MSWTRLHWDVLCLGRDEPRGYVVIHAAHESLSSNMTAQLIIVATSLPLIMLANEKRQVEPVDSVVSIRLEQPRRVTKWKLVALATAAIFYSLTHLTSAPIIDWAGPALLTSSQTVGTTKWWPCGDDAECGTMMYDDVF